MWAKHVTKLVGDHVDDTWNGEVVVDGTRGRTGNAARRSAPIRRLTGDMCRVGIPLALVHVIDVAHCSPPQETGRLPCPSRLVVVLLVGHSFASRLEEQIESFDPEDDIPIAFDLIFRPYAFLRPSDEVADKAGRAWRFDGPRNWHPWTVLSPTIPPGGSASSPPLPRRGSDRISGIRRQYDEYRLPPQGMLALARRRPGELSVVRSPPRLPPS